MGKESRGVVDTTIDKLHDQNKVYWTRNRTLHGYPVFVVWKIIHKPGREPKRKGRMVVDIRGLNRGAEDDPYPMPLQSNIISAVQGATHISIVNIPSFFYG